MQIGEVVEAQPKPYGDEEPLPAYALPAGILHVQKLQLENGYGQGACPQPTIKSQSRSNEETCERTPTAIECFLLTFIP